MNGHPERTAEIFNRYSGESSKSSGFSGGRLTAMSKSSLAESRPSSAVTVTVSVPMSLAPGSPVNIRLEALKVSQAGSAAPPALVAV